MAKSKKTQPNAPGLQHFSPQDSSRQPPLNPYYPSLPDHPPPYPDLSTSYPLSQVNRAAYQPEAMPLQPPSTVIIQSSSYDRRREKYVKSVKKFGYEALLVAIFCLVLSQVAVSLYSKRTCANYLVHQPAKDVSIMYTDVRDYHNSIGLISFVMILALATRVFCTQNGYPGYMFLIGFIALIGTIATGYLAYLSFYSPCVLDWEETPKNIAKSILGKFTDTLPSPDKGVLGERNVLQLAEQDRYGVIVFGIDIFIFILFLSTFLSSLS